MDARIKSGHDKCVCLHTNLYFKQPAVFSHTLAISPRMRASFALTFLTPESEGAGNAGCALHPRSRVQ